MLDDVQFELFTSSCGAQTCAKRCEGQGRGQ